MDRKETQCKCIERGEWSKSLLKTIRKRQMEFLGHVCRRRGLEFLSLTGKVEGKRDRGKQRITFLDSLCNSATGGQSKGLNFLKLSDDRDVWRGMAANVCSRSGTWWWWWYRKESEFDYQNSTFIQKSLPNSKPKKSEFWVRLSEFHQISGKKIWMNGRSVIPVKKKSLVIVQNARVNKWEQGCLNLPFFSFWWIWTCPWNLRITCEPSLPTMWPECHLGCGTVGLNNGENS